MGTTRNGRWMTGLSMAFVLVCTTARPCLSQELALLGVGGATAGGSGQAMAPAPRISWLYLETYAVDGRPIINSYRRTRDLDELCSLEYYPPGLRHWSRRLRTVVGGDPQALDALVRALEAKKLLVHQEPLVRLNIRLDYTYETSGRFFNQSAAYEWGARPDSGETVEQQIRVARLLMANVGETVKNLRLAGWDNGSVVRFSYEVRLPLEREPIFTRSWVRDSLAGRY